MTQLRFGIIGTGMIAGVIADAIAQSRGAALAAVASRTLARARSFVSGRKSASSAEAIEGLDALLRRADIDAVYIASPTMPRESIALASIAADKHVLIEKPFVDLASVQRMTAAADARALVFMDATHFVHHPRTAAIRSAIPSQLGSPRTLHTRFYFPLSDHANIRFDRAKEPAGVLGDLGWYSARAIVAYLQPRGAVASALGSAQFDPSTGAIVRATGMLTFKGGEASTFDVGYTAGASMMDLNLLGTSGALSMDDFVLDWTNSWAFRNPDLRSGYSYRTGAGTLKDVRFIETPSPIPQQVRMIDAFADLVASRDTASRKSFAHATLLTQEIMDAMAGAIETSR